MNEKIKQQSNLDRFGFKAKKTNSKRWLFAGLDDSEELLRWLLRDENNSKYDPAWIDQKTLCQCTGLKDSDGKLIYENDIVKVADRYYTVVYHEPSMSYEINGETDDRNFSTLVSWVKQGVICIVVGNIFDKEEK